MPLPFRSAADYRRGVDALKDGGIVPDESFIWWAIRPSARHPTLEMRVADSCTRIDDAVAIAGLYRALVHGLVQRAEREDAATPSGCDEVRIEENRWQAARHGIDARFLVGETGTSADVIGVLASTVDRAAESLALLACRDCVVDAMRIATSGTSADRQLTVHADAVGARRTPETALQEVARALVAETTAGTLAPA